MARTHFGGGRWHKKAGTEIALNLRGDRLRDSRASVCASVRLFTVDNDWPTSAHYLAVFTVYVAGGIPRNHRAGRAVRLMSFGTLMSTWPSTSPSRMAEACVGWRWAIRQTRKRLGSI